jgi:signal transduction histidine kinase
VTDAADGLVVAVKDDGVGMDPMRRASGLGLRGIEERVRELRGTMSIKSAAGAGTTLTVRLPLPAREPEVLRARAAG